MEHLTEGQLVANTTVRCLTARLHPICVIAIGGVVSKSGISIIDNGDRVKTGVRYTIVEVAEFTQCM